MRTGTLCVKHLSTRQVWVQGAVRGYGIGVRKVKREVNAGEDSLTHMGSEENLSNCLLQMGFYQD